jgi:hypothetical protein
LGPPSYTEVARRGLEKTVSEATGLWLEERGADGIVSPSPKTGKRERLPLTADKRPSHKAMTDWGLRCLR